MSAIPFLRSAQASGEHWGGLVKSIVSALGPLPADVNFGLAYATEELAEDLASIVTFLTETTPIKHWTMAVGCGLIGPISTVRGRASLAVMVANLPEESFRRLESWQEPGRSQFLTRQRLWLAEQGMTVALMHGDMRQTDLAAMIEDMAASAGAYVIGGVTPAQDGGLSGVFLGAPLELVIGLTQGCQPLGGTYRVTEASDDVIMSLDGRPALEAMKEAVGPAMAQDLRRAAGVIHLGLPVAGADRADYLVRPLVAVDPARGWLAANARLAVGDKVMFVRRDAEGAHKDMQRMLTDVAQRADSRSIKGGIYISCVARGAQMFGSDDMETIMIKSSLGDFPIIGLISQGEFCHERIYGYTGVLALLLS